MALIETERMIARFMTEGDVENLLKIFSDPLAMQYYPGTKNREDTIKWVTWVLQSYEDHGHGFYIWELKETKTFVGQCGLIFQADVDGRDEVEIGYLFARKFWNQGLATEAARACKSYGFEHFGFPRLISLIQPVNLPSRRVAEKNGMTIEKTVMRWHKEHLVYAISR